MGRWQGCIEWLRRDSVSDQTKWPLKWTGRWQSSVGYISNSRLMPLCHLTLAKPKSWFKQPPSTISSPDPSWQMMWHGLKVEVLTPKCLSNHIWLTKNFGSFVCRQVKFLWPRKYFWRAVWKGNFWIEAFLTKKSKYSILERVTKAYMSVM